MEELNGLSEVDDGELSVTSNSESVDDMEANFNSEAEDEPKETPEEKRTKAARELGEAGGKAAAEARRAKKAAEPEKDEKTPPEGEEKPLGHPRSDPRARVMQATREAAEERRKRQELEDRLARLEAGRVSQEPERPAQKADREPKIEDFETWEDWADARIDWKAAQKVKQLREEASQEARQVRAVEMVRLKAKTFNERLMASAGEDGEAITRIDPTILDLAPTFLLAPGQAPTPESDMMMAIVESEHPLELMLHLSEHPEERERIAALPSPSMVSQAMGRLEERIMREPERRPQAKEEPISHAHPPVKPIKSSAQTAPEDEPTEDMDLDTFIRVGNAKDSRLRRGGR
jgi:hypothetical protein